MTKLPEERSKLYRDGSNVIEDAVYSALFENPIANYLRTTMGDYDPDTGHVGYMHGIDDPNPNNNISPVDFVAEKAVLPVGYIRSHLPALADSIEYIDEGRDSPITEAIRQVPLFGASVDMRRPGQNAFEQAVPGGAYYIGAVPFALDRVGGAVLGYDPLLDNFDATKSAGDYMMNKSIEAEEAGYASVDRTPPETLAEGALASLPLLNPTILTSKGAREMAKHTDDVADFGEGFLQLSEQVTKDISKKAIRDANYSFGKNLAAETFGYGTVAKGMPGRAGIYAFDGTAAALNPEFPTLPPPNDVLENILENPGLVDPEYDRFVHEQLAQEGQLRARLWREGEPLYDNHALIKRDYLLGALTEDEAYGLTRQLLFGNLGPGRSEITKSRPDVTDAIEDPDD